MSKIVDAGCGDGLHLFWTAQNAPPPVCLVGLDKSTANLAFCARYARAFELHEIQFQKMDLTDWTNSENPTVDLIFCVGTLQYIDNDEAVLTNFYQHLQPNGYVLIYTPVNGRFLLPMYKNLFNKLDNYEKQQNRTRIYTTTEIVNKLEKAGFTIEDKIYSHGKWGILSFEWYNIFLLLITNSRFMLVQAFYLLCLLISLPFIFLLKFIDYFQHLKDGNGLTIVAKKC